MTFWHAHDWARYEGREFHERCVVCLMHRVSGNFGRQWCYRCSGDVGIGLWDSEIGAVLSALHSLDRLVPVKS